MFLYHLLNIIYFKPPLFLAPAFFFIVRGQRKYHLGVALGWCNGVLGWVTEVAPMRSCYKFSQLQGQADQCQWWYLCNNIFKRAKNQKLLEHQQWRREGDVKETPQKCAANEEGREGGVPEQKLPCNPWWRPWWVSLCPWSPWRLEAAIPLQPKEVNTGADIPPAAHRGYWWSRYPLVAQGG